MIYTFGQYESKFKEWCRDPEFPALEPLQKQLAIDFLRNIDSPNFKPVLWNHQKESIKRVLFSFEVLGKTDLLLDIVTGGGKSTIISGLIAYLRIVRNLQKFLILVPNTIVRSRLVDEFNKNSPKFAYDTFPFFFNSHSFLKDHLSLHVMEQGASITGLRSANIILGNIHQFYEGHTALDVLKENCGDLVIFNDEAHNSVAMKYNDVLNYLKPQRVLRIDLTATPDRLDGQHPDSEKILEYGVRKAMIDRIIKRVIVTKPDIEKVKLTYVDTETGEIKNAEEIPWEQIELHKIPGSKYVVSEKPMKQQLAIAKECLEYQRKNCVDYDATGKPKWKPLLFVVALSINDAKNIAKVLELDLNLKTLVVTNQSEDSQKKEAEELNRHIADTPYDAVVSVLMLREGWDVKNIGVICLFRKFTFKKVGDRVMSVYGPQIIGRGLRRIDPHNKEEWEQCFVVDHPILKHDWLWKMLDAAEMDKPINPGDEIKPEDIPTPPPLEGNETEEKIDEKTPADIEEILLNIPKPNLEDSYQVIYEWQQFLDDYQYSTDRVDIEQFIRQVISRDVVSGFNEQETANLQIDVHKIQESKELSVKELKERIDSDLIDIAHDALLEYDRNPDKRQDIIYSVLIEHIKKRFLLGKTAFEVEEKSLLDKLWFTLTEMREVFLKPELIEGILKHPPISHD